MTDERLQELITLGETVLQHMDISGEFIAHHGVKGQEWYKHKNGPWQNHAKYAAGKSGPKANPKSKATDPPGFKPYKKNDVVFVSGSSKTQSSDSPYYRKKLPEDISAQLDKIVSAGSKVVVGDAPGIDRQVQDYLNKKKYSNVEIYGPGKAVRYTANKNWKTNPIDAPQYEQMSSEWLAEKDKAMEKAATKGIAVVLDEGSKATRRNIERLKGNKKDAYVYELRKGGDSSWV